MRRSIPFLAAQHFSGPLPPPLILEQYNRVVPGLAEHLVTLVEKQSAHRQSIESKIVESRIRSEMLGQVFAFILAVILATGSMWLIHEGKNIAGLATLVAGIGGLVGVFVFARIRQERELAARHRLPEPEPSKD